MTASSKKPLIPLEDLEKKESKIEFVVTDFSSLDNYITEIKKIINLPASDCTMYALLQLSNRYENTEFDFDWGTQDGKCILDGLETYLTQCDSLRNTVISQLDLGWKNLERILLFSVKYHQYKTNLLGFYVSIHRGSPDLINLLEKHHLPMSSILEIFYQGSKEGYHCLWESIAFRPYSGDPSLDNVNIKKLFQIIATCTDERELLAIGEIIKKAATLYDGDKEYANYQILSKQLDEQVEMLILQKLKTLPTLAISKSRQAILVAKESLRASNKWLWAQPMPEEDPERLKEKGLPIPVKDEKLKKPSIKL